MGDLGALAALADRHLETFLLVFCRIGAMVMAAPVLGHRSIPVAHRAGLSFLLAMVLTPLVGAGRGSQITDAVALGLAVAGELLVGVVIGFVASLALAAVEGAGELVGTQMGLGLTSLFDPSTGDHPGVVARFQNLVAMLVLLALNIHHLMIQAVATSFRRIRPGMLAWHGESTGGIVALGGTLFRSGLELAAPLVGILLVANVGLALLARVAPQTNVFLLGIPITVGLGLIGIAETLPYLSATVSRLSLQLLGDLDVLLGGGAHGPW